MALNIQGEVFNTSLFFVIIFKESQKGGVAMNLLTTVKGDPLSFSVYHKENNELYSLDYGEVYRINIKRTLTGADNVLVAESDNTGFEVPTTELECGNYYFELELVNNIGVPRCISPATDIHGNCSNMIVITERLGRK